MENLPLTQKGILVEFMISEDVGRNAELWFFQHSSQLCVDQAEIANIIIFIVVASCWTGHFPVMFNDLGVRELVINVSFICRKPYNSKLSSLHFPVNFFMTPRSMSKYLNIQKLFFQ